MQIDDLSNNPRIASLMEMMRRVEQDRTPFDTLCTVRNGLESAYGPSAYMELSTQGLAPGQFRLIRLQLPGMQPEPLLDPWTSPEFPVLEGGVIGEIILSDYPLLVHDVDWSADPFFRGTLSGYRSLMAVPIRGHDLPFNWALVLDKGPQHFEATELEEAVLRAALVGPLLGCRALSAEIVRAHAQVDQEVERVGQIQRSLLPDPLPQIPSLQIATSYETCGRAGGDLYDFIPLGRNPAAPDRWGIFLADASGHGPSAAVVIAIVQALLHAHPIGVDSPAALLRHLNQQLCRRPIEASFVTAFLGIFRPSSRRLTYAVAGHPAPLIREPGRVSDAHLNSIGRFLPLGINAAEPFGEATVDLLPGADLLLYTDGITEAWNAAGELLGTSALQRVFRNAPPSPAALVTAVRDAVRLHEQGRPAEDDQTLVAIHVADGGWAGRTVRPSWNTTPRPRP
jgi:phosphoserine phosphatase RsbU/P